MILVYIVVLVLEGAGHFGLSRLFVNASVLHSSTASLTRSNLNWQGFAFLVSTHIQSIGVANLVLDLMVSSSSLAGFLMCNIPWDLCSLLLG
jgi:hypothetical protein